ncbi:MAG: helix-hairpin-helix domain-containing protein [Anaerolineae bacterium]
MARYRGYLVLSLLFLLVLGFGVTLLRRPAAPVLEITDPSPEATSRPGVVGVYIIGAVQVPGVYYLPEGSRIYDALEAAGGPTGEADLVRVAMAQRLTDEQTVYVPRVGETAIPVLAPPGNESGGKVNINRADLSQLDTLPGIGPGLAQRILDYRRANGPFKTIEDLLAVPGIGETIFLGLRDLITV